MPWTSQELAERQDDVIRLLVAVLDGISRGDFMIAPWKDDGSACKYCDFNEICPGARGGYVERKGGDDRLSQLAIDIRSIAMSGALIDQGRATVSRQSSTATCASRPQPAPERRPCSSTGW